MLCVRILAEKLSVGSLNKFCWWKCMYILRNLLVFWSMINDVREKIGFNAVRLQCDTRYFSLPDQKKIILAHWPRDIPIWARCQRNETANKAFSIFLPFFFCCLSLFCFFFLLQRICLICVSPMHSGLTITEGTVVNRWKAATASISL